MRSTAAVVAEFSSATPEHYSPPAIVELGRRVMGAIDLDPASCAVANETVQAQRFFAREDDGLVQRWLGRVWLNPPGSCHDDAGNLTTCYQPPRTAKGVRKEKKSCTCKLPQKFFRRLGYFYHLGEVTEFVWLAFNISQLRTLQGGGGDRLLGECAVCIPRERMRFTGDSPTKDNAVLYGGPNHAHFRRVFEEIGEVWTR